jgi:hypothetical protein
MARARRPPQVDERNTSVTFVDVLFALVVAKILDVSIDGNIPSVAKAHLVVGAVLTITSWVGYHNSVNRSPYFLRFWNLPIFLFTIDICLVYIYWLFPVLTVDPVVDGQPQVPTAIPATLLIAIASALYVLWDLVALSIRKSPD